MNNHTPAPWKACPEQVGKINQGLTAFTIHYAPLLSQEECEANDALIAAVPDLLDANEKAINALVCVRHSYMVSEYKGQDKVQILAMINMALKANRAAIAKAKG